MLRSVQLNHQQGRFLEAAQLADQIKLRFPDMAAYTSNNVGLAYWDANRTQEAFGAFVNGYRKCDRSDTLLLHRIVYHALGTWFETEFVFGATGMEQDMLNLIREQVIHPLQVDLPLSGRFSAARLAYRLGDYPLAMIAYERILPEYQAENRHYEIFHNLGLIEMWKGNNAEAISWMSQAVELAIAAHWPKDLIKSHHQFEMVWLSLLDPLVPDPHFDVSLLHEELRQENFYP